MALKLELKPGERVIIGGTVITNGEARSQLLIEGDDTPILREKDVLTSETADSPAKRIYLAIQMMYLEDISRFQETYFLLINEFLKAVPSSLPYIDAINHKILTGHLYNALKEAKNLIAYEEELLRHA